MTTKPRRLKDCGDMDEVLDYVDKHDGVTDEDLDEAVPVRVEISEKPGSAYSVRFDYDEARLIEKFCEERKQDIFRVLKVWVMERLRQELKEQESIKAQDKKETKSKPKTKRRMAA